MLLFPRTRDLCLMSFDELLFLVMKMPMIPKLLRWWGQRQRAGKKRVLIGVVVTDSVMVGDKK